MNRTLAGIVALIALFASAPQAQQTRNPQVIVSDLEKLVAELKAALVPPPPPVVLVKTSAELQAAVNVAPAGSVIFLHAGTRYDGQIVLPVRSGAPVTLRSDAVLPERRITEADAALLPTLASTSS